MAHTTSRTGEQEMIVLKIVGERQTEEIVVNEDFPYLSMYTRLQPIRIVAIKPRGKIVGLTSDRIDIYNTQTEATENKNASTRLFDQRGRELS